MILEKEWQIFRDAVLRNNSISESAMAIARLTFYAGAYAMAGAFGRPDTDVAAIVRELDAFKQELEAIEERENLRKLTRY
jgi:hypothetical protein